MYIHVATSTMVEPMTNVGVMRKPKRTTEARKDKTMDKLVAKPFKMLSEYLMTMAVMSPPRTWMVTVAQAQPPKFRSILAQMPP